MEPAKIWPSLEEIKQLCESVQKEIEPDDRAYDDDDEPGILLTVGSNGKGSWSFQTGDTQFHGGAYGYQFWGQAAIRDDTDCAEAAQLIRDELDELIDMAD